MQSFLLRAGCACFLLCSVTVGLAAETASDQPQGALTLQQATAAALKRNPNLAASSYELKAADARITQAGVRPNPELSLQLENFAGTGAAAGTDAFQATLSLSQVLELGNKREYRKNAATANQAVISVDRQGQELDIFAEVTRRFIDVIAAQARMALATNTLALSDKTLETIGARVQAARSPEAERSRARIQRIRAQIDLTQAEGQLRTARQQLAAQWGSTDPKFSEGVGDLFALDPVVPFEIFAQRIERNPELTRFASEARLRDAELRLAQAQARPNLTLSMGVRRLQETKDSALVAGFSIPLPISDRNQGAIREAQVRREQNAAQQSAALLRTRAMIFALYQELSSARTRLTIIQDEALAQAQTAVEQTQYGYERGRFSYLELISAQQELLSLRASAIDAAADYHRALAEIERLTSEPLTRQSAEGTTP